MWKKLINKYSMGFIDYRQLYYYKKAIRVLRTALDVQSNGTYYL